MRFLFAILFATVLHAFDSTIPVVDLQDFHNPDRREEFLSTLRCALTEVGFFGVVNTAVDRGIVDKAYDDIADFFHLDLDTKMQYDGRQFGGERGYTPKYREVALGHTAGNFMEYYHIGRTGNSATLTPNVWPQEKDIRSTAKLFAVIESAAEPIVEAFSLIIGQENGFMKELLHDGETIFRMIHYPPQVEKSNQESFWAAPHIDNGLFTILPRATAKGLEVQMQDGSWVPVMVPDDAFVVNVGEKFVNLTNGLFRAAMHRVKAPDDEPQLERYSMVLFNHPRADADLSPLESCIAQTGGKQKYPRASSREILLEFLVANDVASDEMCEEFALSGLSERRVALGEGRLDPILQLEKRGLASKEILAYLEYGK